MRAALGIAGLPEMDAARAAAAARLEAEQRHGAASAALESVASKALAPLREALAGISKLEGGEDGPTFAATGRAGEMADIARLSRAARNFERLYEADEAELFAAFTVPRN